MRHDFHGRQRSRIVFGAFIIAVGVFALLDNLNLFDSRLVQPYWPLVFVALGGLHFVQHAGQPHRSNGMVFSLGLVAVGAAMTLNNLGLVHFHVRDWWPALLILAGVSVATRGFRPRRGWRHGRGGPGDGSADAFAGYEGQRDEREEHGSRLDASAVMSGLVLKNDSQDFQGGEISTVMGAVEIDLRQASIVGEARLHLSIIMGGVEIRVPRDWSVSIVGTPTLGGIEDKTVPPLTPGKRLVIEGSVVMGGVEIDN